MSEREHVWERKGLGRARRRDVRARDEVAWRATVRAPDASEAGDAFDEELGPRSPSPRVRLVAAVAAFSLLVTSAGVCLANAIGGDDWVAVGRADQLRAEGVVAVRSPDIFIVWDADVPIALVRGVPERPGRVEYCAASGWFQDPLHGSTFDRLGLYRLGPAPRGLDRMTVRIRDGIVEVDPTRIVEGPPRGTASAHNPEGPFCVDVNPDLI